MSCTRANCSRARFDGIFVLRTNTDLNPLAARGVRGDLIKILWHDGLGMSLYAKRLEHGKFVWPRAAPGRSADRRARQRTSCGSTCGDSACGADRIAIPGTKINGNQHATWHYILIPACTD